jgi:hypothetical protein
MAILPPSSDGVHAAPIRNDPAWIAAGQQAEAVARADGWSVKGLTYNRRVLYLVEVEADYSTHYVLIYQRRVLSGGGITALADYLRSSGVWNEPKLRSEDMRKLVEIFDALPPFDHLGSVRPSDYQGAFSDTPPRPALAPRLERHKDALIYTLTYLYRPSFPPGIQPGSYPNPNWLNVQRWALALPKAGQPFWARVKEDPGLMYDIGTNKFIRFD